MKLKVYVVGVVIAAFRIGIAAPIDTTWIANGSQVATCSAPQLILCCN